MKRNMCPIRSTMAPPRAVYVHIPFCASKCPYCDFNTYVVSGQPVDAYLDALEREMEQAVDRMPPGRIATIFIGGGTPTILSPAQLAKLLSALQRSFADREPDFEFTVEANPGTVDAEKLCVLREGGVNRISFGAQSFDDRLLVAIGRDHQADDVFRAVETAKQAGFVNISIDLMFGLPRQTVADLNRTLDAALSLGLPHVSAYSLKIEENTPFSALRAQNRLPLPDEDEEADMYALVIDRMRAAGYVHYEVSNFAKPGFECRHNLTYWRNLPYYGLGAGAHGYVGGRRYANVRGVRAYIEAVSQGLPEAEASEVTETEEMENFMILGLRLLEEGVSSDVFRTEYGCSPESVFGGPIRRLLAKGWLERTEKGYRLTRDGLMFGNEVFAAFVGEAVAKEARP